MKPSRKKQFLLIFLRQHVPYIALAFVITLCWIGLSVVATARITGVTEQIEAEKAEVAQLDQKRALLSSVHSQDLETLEQDLAFMNRLIPESENYFSIIQTLERLSVSTGFQVSSYTINLDNSSETKLSLMVNGEGSSEAFLRFLNSYSGDGGRFITIEQISLDPQQPNGIQLNLNFYAKSSQEPVAGANYQATLDELSKLKAKTRFELTPQEQASETGTSTLPTKNNPF